MLLNRMIDEAAHRGPDDEAIRCDGVALSYGELASRAGGLAKVLLATGVERRDRVAVLLGKSLDVSTAFYGVLATGGVVVPIDPRSPVEQIVRILVATGARHLVSEPGKSKVVRDVLSAYPSVSHVIGLSPESDFAAECVPWATVLEEASGHPPDVSVIDLDPAYILHTSGTTGVPKLIQHTHASAMSFVDWAVSEYGLTRDDRLSNHSSHHTCFATFDYYAAARAGATTIVLTPSVLMMPGSLAALLEQERVSVWYSVPTGLVQLSLRGELASRDLSSLRWVLFAGESFPEKHLRRIMRQLPEARFSHVYGSTETNVCTYYHLPQSGDSVTPLPIGKACSNSSTRVVDAELQDSDAGELLVRGSTLMSGYWGEPEKNRGALVRLPSDGEIEETYFRTGDQVHRLADGNLAFTARADLQVKVRGHRVELEGVEEALLSLESVEFAAAFEVPDGEGSSSIRAAVVLGAGERSTERDILAGLRKRLPPYAIPAEITPLDALPRTATGKVDRNALRALLREGVSSE